MSLSLKPELCAVYLSKHENVAEVRLYAAFLGQARGAHLRADLAREGNRNTRPRDDEDYSSCPVHTGGKGHYNPILHGKTGSRMWLECVCTV
jgi:hypothetical protein